MALANPVASTRALTNIGSATVTPPDVVNVADPNLLVPTQLNFNTPSTTFQVNGAGPLIPFTNGAAISVNGRQVRITGSPAAGDVFRIDLDSNGSGDNANGLAMAGLRTSEILNGGTASLQDAYGQLIGQVGSRTQQALISRDAIKVQREYAEASRDAISAVNLDEEAANLIRFQQAFQAAAQLIQVTNQTFASLLEAMR